MIIMTTTNIYKGFQLHIPKEIREKHNIKKMTKYPGEAKEMI